MTPRERWEAAVLRQHEAARAIAELPPDADEAAQRRMCDVVNGATDELSDLARELPKGTFSNEEWTAAYSIHRDAMIAETRRKRSRDALAAVEAVSAGSRAFYQLARRHFA